jgi:tripartite ATP-independent transporter DctP family solute receptor
VFQTITGTIGAALVAVALALPAQAAELRLGGVHAPNSFETRALQKFAELAKAKSGGSLDISVYPAGQLGDERTMIDMINTGAIDMFANVADWNQHLVKDFAILSMPFAFEDLDHLRAFQASATYEAMKRRMLDEKNVRVVADNWYRPPRVLLTREPVTALADLDGRKLRMPDIEAFVKTWSAFGAKPTIIPFAEAFLSLKTGVVDGMEAPLSSIYAQKFYQVAPHITMTNHGMAPFNVLMSETSFQALSPDEQKALVAAAQEAGAFYVSEIANDFGPQREKMIAEGASFDEIPLAPFAEKARAVAMEFEGRGTWAPGLFDEIQSMK